MNLIKNVCYHEPKYVFKINNVEYFAADANGVSKFNDGLVINLCGSQKMPSALNMPHELMLHMQIPYTEIMVPWPDGETPLVKYSFWKGLHEYCEERGYDKVCFHCEAGHGRTGTALAALAISNLNWSSEQAIRHIRRVVCRYMVETFEQTIYLGSVDETFNKRIVSEEELPDPSMLIMMEEIKAMKGD